MVNWRPSGAQFFGAISDKGPGPSGAHWVHIGLIGSLGTMDPVMSEPIHWAYNWGHNIQRDHGHNYLLAPVDPFRGGGEVKPNLWANFSGDFRSPGPIIWVPKMVIYENGPESDCGWSTHRSQSPECQGYFVFRNQVKIDGVTRLNTLRDITYRA